METFFFIAVYSLMCYGLCNLVVFFEGPFGIITGFRRIMNSISRPIGKMFDCMACTSTNVGWILSLVNLLFFKDTPFTPFNIIFGGHATSNWFLVLVLDAGYTSGIVWFLWRLEEMMNRIGVDKGAYDDGKPLGADIDDPKQQLND